MAEAAADVPAGADGLLVLPYFAGERTPIFDPHARGVVAGLTLRHGARRTSSAPLYEGTAYGIRHILEVLADAAEAPRGSSPSAGARRAACGRRSSAT